MFFISSLLYAKLIFSRRGFGSVWSTSGRGSSVISGARFKVAPAERSSYGVLVALAVLWEEFEAEGF